MFLKLLIFIVLGVVLYRAARTWFGAGPTRRPRAGGATPEKVDDEMIKDPECGVYFPRRNAVALTDHNEVLYFCSTECRDRYLASQSRKAAS